MEPINAESTRQPSVLGQRFRGFLPVVVDIETAGFNSATDAILQLAAQTVDADERGYLSEAESYFYEIVPFEGANLEPAALAFTGIDPHDEERAAIDEKEALKELFSGIRQQIKLHGCTRAILVGHNAHFDLGFINAACDRHNIKRNPFHPFSTFDTVTLAAMAYGQTVLAKACDVAGIEFDNESAHNAAYDTAKTTQLFCKIINRWQTIDV